MLFRSRSGYADKVLILTSGENMSLHAAANIGMAVEHFHGRNYAELGGLILNRRNVRDEDQKVRELAEDLHTGLLGSLDWSETVQAAEPLNKTVLEAFPNSEMAQQYRVLTETILHTCGGTLC